MWNKSSGVTFGNIFLFFFHSKLMLSASASVMYRDNWYAQLTLIANDRNKTKISSFTKTHPSAQINSPGLNRINLGQYIYLEDPTIRQIVPRIGCKIVHCGYGTDILWDLLPALPCVAKTPASLVIDHVRWISTNLPPHTHTYTYGITFISAWI